METKKAAIIDAPAGSLDWIIEQLKGRGLQAEMLLLTHSHWDHFADAARLKERLHVPLYVHEKDAPNLEQPGKDGLPFPIEIPPVEPDHLLEDGEVIPLGSLEIQVIHTPGHSPGGVGFYLASEGVLISGDTLFKGSMGKVNFPQSEPEKMWESLKKLSQLPAATRVIPGHGEETTLADESWIKDAKAYFGFGGSK